MNALFLLNDEGCMVLRGTPLMNCAIKKGREIYFSDHFIGTVQELQQISDDNMESLVISRLARSMAKREGERFLNS